MLGIECRRRFAHGKKLGFFAAAVALLALSAACGADLYLTGRQYFDLRRKVGISGRASPPPGVREICGRLSGIARTDSYSLLTISGDGDSECIRAPAGSAEIVMGNHLRVILRTDTDGTPEMMAYTYEADAAEIERAALAKEKKRTAKPAVARTGASSRQTRTDVTTSRGVAADSAAGIIAQYARAVRTLNPRLSDSEAEVIARSVLICGQYYNVDPRLVMAVIWAESNFRPEATSPRGAMGLGQLMPATAASLGVYDPYDPVQNIAGSVRVIRGHLERLSGYKKWDDLTWDHLMLALASYNAGSGAVRKYGGIPPYKETRSYIQRVLGYYRRLCGQE